MGFARQRHQPAHRFRECRWRDDRVRARVAQYAAGGMGGPAFSPGSADSCQRRGETRLGKGSERQMAKRWVQRTGVSHLSAPVFSRSSLSDDRLRPWRTFVRHSPRISGRRWFDGAGCFVASRLLRIDAQPTRQLRSGRGIHACERPGFWAWRPARYHGRR